MDEGPDRCRRAQQGDTRVERTQQTTDNGMPCMSECPIERKSISGGDTGTHQPWQ